MSEAANHKLSYVVESTRGTTPTNPRFQRLPDTRTTLALTKDNLESERVTGDRFPAEPRTGAKGVSGDISADLSAVAYDDFLESALQGTFTNDAGAGSDSCLVDQEGVDHAGKVVGDTFTTVANTGTVTLEYLDSRGQYARFRYDPPADAAATTYELFNTTDTVEIDGDTFQIESFTDGAESATLKAGTTRKSFSIMRQFSDMATKGFSIFSGCEITTWNLSAAANNIAKSVFGVFGRDMTGPQDAAPTNTDYIPAHDYKPFDTFKGELKIDTVANCTVTDYNITINNNHTAKFAVGCETSQDPSVGQSDVEGSITMYFEDAALWEKFINDESFALELTLQDLQDRKLIIDLPNCRIGSGTQPDVGGDGPITITVNFTAHKDETLGSHISVQRVYPVAA